MTWYKTGTVTVTAGSTTVTGASTRFVENLMVGDIFYGPDNRLYEITNIASNTALAVSPAYQGATAAGQAYSVIYTQARNKQLADRAASLIGSYDTAKALAEGSLQKADNLGGLTDKAAARDNLGLGPFGTLDLDALSNGRIVVMRTPKGQPTYMYRIPQFNCEDVDPSGALGAGVHPAFLFNGVPAKEILVGAYLAAEVNGEIVCQPGHRPRASLNFDQSRQKCRDLGAGWDIMSNWDWAAIALWCMANGFQPRGNTQYGRNHDRRFETGTRYAGGAAGDSSIGDGTTLTGSGPASWNHDGTPAGISDLVGNVWEWSSGLILRNGQFEVAPDNGTYTEAQYTKTGVAAVAEGTFSSRPYTAPPAILRRALAVPTAGLAPAGHFWRNVEGECLPLRSGGWTSGGNCGLGALDLSSARSRAVSRIGFRPRFRNP